MIPVYAQGFKLWVDDVEEGVNGDIIDSNIVDAEIENNEDAMLFIAENMPELILNAAIKKALEEQRIDHELSRISEDINFGI